MSAAVITPTVAAVTVTAASPVTPVTPPRASTAGASSSNGAAVSTATGSATPAVATSSMGEYLESALSAMEVKFAARKLAFKNSLQETINVREK